jgi:hypothetical protein
MVSATVNETRPVDHALVKRLQKEVFALKEIVRQLTLTVESQSQAQLSPGITSPRTGPRLTESKEKALSPIIITASPHPSPSSNAVKLELKKNSQITADLEHANASLRREVDDLKAQLKSKSSPVKLPVPSSISPKSPPVKLKLDRVELGRVEESLVNAETVADALSSLWTYRSNIQVEMSPEYSHCIAVTERADYVGNSGEVLSIRNRRGGDA